MNRSHLTRLVISVLAGTATFYGLQFFLTIVPPNIQFWILGLLCLPVGIIALGLVMFFFIQVYDTWTKDGAGAALALAFTSIVVFPAVTLLEVIENLIFPPLGFPSKSQEKGELVLGGGKFAHMEGVVYHLRTEQAVNDFRYRVNYTVVPLDRPPADFAGDFLTAAQARAFASTDGPVLLLTDLYSVGYHQNPISVYYCYSLLGDIKICIAEVTNTPWGEKVQFLFDPAGDVVPKSMHVSPFVDMNRCWRLVASLPAAVVEGSIQRELADARFRLLPQCELTVTVIPNCASGSNLNAVMKMRPRVVTSGRSSWGRVRDYCMPQRVALRIYWQAVVLLCKGVRYCPHPREVDAKAYDSLVSRAGTRARQEGKIAGRDFVFTEFSADNSRKTRVEKTSPSDARGSTSESKLAFYDGQQWQQGH